MEHQHEHKNRLIKDWIRDRIIFLAVVIFIFGAITYIIAGEIFDHDSLWLHPVKEFALLISMIGVVSLGYELFLREMTFNEYKDALQEIVNSDAARLGIKGIYKNRAELGKAVSFERLFRDVKKEIFIGGSSLLSISTNSRDLLREKVLGGVNVKLLLMSPHSKVVEMITQQGAGKATFINEIKTSLLLFQKLKEEIDEYKNVPRKGRLEVHIYDQIPSHSFIAIDSSESHGVIIADIGPYLGRSSPRPSMFVTKKKDGLFDYWVEMNNTLWLGSKSYLSDTVGQPLENIKTLVLVSGHETEYFDAEQGEWTESVLCETPNSWRGIKGSQWIAGKEAVSLEEAKTGGKYKFRFRFDLPNWDRASLSRADLFLRADDSCRITVNDTPLNHEFGGADYPEPFFMNVVQHIQKGENQIEFEVTNSAKPTVKSPEENPTGLIYRLDIEYHE